MKNNLIILLMAIAAFGFSGCSPQDDTKADLKWKNNAGAAVQDIKWVKGGDVDQSWDGTTADLAETSPKGITELAGAGECLDNSGTPSTIKIVASGSEGFVAGTLDDTGTNEAATIEKNAAATLVINSIVPAVK